MNPLDLQKQVIQPLAAQLQQRFALAVAQPAPRSPIRRC